MKRPAMQQGQAAFEYLVVVSLFALALVVGPDSPLEQLFGALNTRFELFTHALSRP
ncbi:MAG TPA: hypothetical protein PKA20_03845 [Burkholderiaceae bacterium]|nr:hypothetical protein [Burkholderiaceae bacterium]